MTDTLSGMLTRQVARWTDRKGDWDAFADARVDGYRRAQHRFIGYGAHYIQEDNPEAIGRSIADWYRQLATRAQ